MPLCKKNVLFLWNTSLELKVAAVELLAGLVTKSIFNCEHQYQLVESLVVKWSNFNTMLEKDQAAPIEWTKGKDDNDGKQ